MGYREALEIAGAKVVDFKEFGSYQGTWLALVEYKGQKGIVQGCYGSCSGCDAFKAEFGSSGNYISGGEYYLDYEEVTKEEYDVIAVDENKRLCDFGLKYLESCGLPDLYDKAHYRRLKLKTANEDDWFSNEELEYIDWALSQDF